MRWCVFYIKDTQDASYQVRTTTPIFGTDLDGASAAVFFRKITRTTDLFDIVATSQRARVLEIERGDGKNPVCPPCSRACDMPLHTRTAIYHYNISILVFTNVHVRPMLANILFCILGCHNVHSIRRFFTIFLFFFISNLYIIYIDSYILYIRTQVYCNSNPIS